MRLALIISDSVVSRDQPVMTPVLLLFVSMDAIFAIDSLQVPVVPTVVAVADIYGIHAQGPPAAVL